mmetsp:Transcript_43798/g.85950  ORF Transcript_43798/g.85950 Transcript_43798/m.85950 type:complete len:81 (+) Transcript_43798:527-769(+)
MQNFALNYISFHSGTVYLLKSMSEAIPQMKKTKMTHCLYALLTTYDLMHLVRRVFLKRQHLISFLQSFLLVLKYYPSSSH